MKKLLALLFLALPMGLFAQEVKIAYVDVQAVFSAMPEVPGIEKQMSDLNDQYQKDLKSMQDEYQKKYSDFTAQQDSLTENIKLRRMQEIQELQNRIENFYPIAQDDINKKQQQLVAPVQDKIKNAIKAVGEEKGYTYILAMNPQLFLYTGNGAIDATPFVKAKLGLK
ncbi:MAG: OmpH family outer membrane protein [Tannerella sp.]|jgi:outer membrane protein|nr:OmpH family outer membrane protein [Tannerella sp.]